MREPAIMSAPFVSIRAAMETYRSELDALEWANWTGDVVESSRRIRALNRIGQDRPLAELEALAARLGASPSDPI